MIVVMNPLLPNLARPVQRMLMAICLAVVVVATPMTARAADDESREAAMSSFVADLRVAAKHL